LFPNVLRTCVGLAAEELLHMRPFRRCAPPQFAGHVRRGLERRDSGKRLGNLTRFPPRGLGIVRRGVEWRVSSRGAHWRGLTRIHLRREVRLALPAEFHRPCPRIMWPKTSESARAIFDSGGTARGTMGARMVSCSSAGMPRCRRWSKKIR